MASDALLLLFLLTTLFLGTSIYLEKYRKRRSSKLPPGKMTSWPLIGDTISYFNPHPINILGSFMEHHISRYGKVFSCNLLGKRTIISTDAELNQFILSNDSKFLPGYPRTLGNVLGKTFMVGDSHKQMRSHMHNFMSAERVRSVFLQDAEQIAALVVSSWKDGSVVSAVEEATKFSFYIMGKETLGMAPGGAEMEKLRKDYEMLIGGLFALPPVYFPGTAYWKAFQARLNIMKTLKAKVEERMIRKGDEGIQSQNDFFNWLMKNTDYSHEQIIELSLQTIFAGHDTTSRAISTMIYLLEGCPRAIEQLREEHLHLVQSKKSRESMLTWDDYKDMAFTQCVIKETLRLSNISPTVMRKSVEEIHFKGYEIPRGSSVIPHFKAVHLDPIVFEEPDHFNPWRWMGTSNINIRKNFMPFGGGARLCLGAELAKLELTIFLHYLIINYNWELVEPDHPMSTPIVKYQKGLPIKLHAL